jgi:signal transduction histidine kinase/FixJ family two-component response regulator/HPt (histidine-containing phosphotransfer) domain-containing protein
MRDITVVRNLILAIQMLGICIPLLGIIVLVQKEQGRSSLFLVMTNLGCLLMNGGYFLLLRTHSKDVAGLAYSLQYVGNIVFYLFFIIFILSYLHIPYPKFFTYLWGTFEFIDLVILWGFPNSGLIYKDLFFLYHNRMGILTVHLTAGPLYLLRYSVICCVVLALLIYTSVRIFMVENEDEKSNLARLAGAQFLVVVSLNLMLRFNFDYDVVPLFASLAIIAIIIGVVHGEMLRITDSGREWVVEHMENAFVITDSSYGYLEANAIARDIFPGLQRMRKNTRVPEQLYRLMTQEETTEEIDGRFYEKEIVALREKDKIEGYSLLLMDVTAQHELMEELKDAKQRAEDANQAKSAFMSNMSHEIRTPMNAIVGMTEILMRRDLPEQEREYLSNIQNSGNALLKIINDILDFSKIESGKLEIIEETYEPMSMLSDLGMIFLNRIGEKPVELLFDIDGNLPAKLYGDELRIRQVVINLMNNAIKFTESGYVKLTIQVKEKKDDTVMLFFAVEDTGQGIAQDDLQKLFGSFQQVDIRKNHHKEGTGLGLSISRQLIEMMGGKIEVTSEYGKGSKFYFTLGQKIMDAGRASDIKEEHREDVVLFRFENPLLDEMAKKLAQTYGIFVAKEETDAVRYIFTDNPKMVSGTEREALEKRGGVLYVLRNPMLDSVWNVDEISLNKPLYSLNFCQAVNRDTQRKEGEADENLNFTAKDAKILLVDDNEMNLKVAIGLLEPLQMQIDTAQNGKQAVGMVQNKQYDIVFMDHMMPVMDGVEATKAIRKLEGATYQKLPIVALSANATTEAREMFKKEGMDDFVAKPIRMKDICRCILKWLPETFVDRQNTEKEETAPGETVLTPIGDLDIDEAIANCGSQKTFLRMLGDFYKLIDAKSIKLEKCLADGMIRDYTIEVHALKNTARLIGAMELSEQFYRLEQLGNEENVEQILQYHPKTMELFQSYKPLLEPYAGGDNQEKQEVSNEVLRETLRRLHDAIDGFDLDGADEAMKELETYRFPDDMLEMFRQLQVFMADVAMDDILQLTDAMCNQLTGGQ